jgi:protein SPT2
MSSFASLLAQSKAQTQARNVAVQSALAQRQERERRDQEESERKHREELARQAKQRQAQAEAQKREAERVKHRELEQQAKEQERERKKKAEMDKLLGKKRHEEREREPSGAGSRTDGSGSPRKRRSRSNSPSGGGGGPVLTRMERRALKTDPNARPAWAISLVGERGGHSSSPSPHPKLTSGARTKRSSQLSGVKNGNGYGEAIKLSRKETGSVVDYLEEKRQRELATGKSKSYLNSGGPSSRAVSTGPLPNKSKVNGSKPKSAPSSVVGHKRRRSDEEDEDSMFDSDGEDDDDVPPTKRRAIGGSVLARFGLDLNRREYHDYDDDDLSDMEAGYDEVERENEKAYVIFFSLPPPLLQLCGVLTTIPDCSLREAKREDRIALEEETRHEEEKRKRKMARMTAVGRA